MQMTWRGTDLYWGRRKVGSIVPDDRYPRMWRVLRSDGSLSDMASYARARDAAKTIAARELQADNPEAPTVAIEGNDEAV